MPVTFAQRRLLERLIANPGCAVVIEARERSGTEGPSFHGAFYNPACATCGHRTREPTSWRVIFALREAGYIAPQNWTDDSYDAEGITKAGHAALANKRRAG